MPHALTRSELLKRRLDRFTRVLDGLEQGDVRALHRARVASRRLRELVPALQLERNVSKKLSRRLRRVTVRLGVVRELDVLLMLIDELHVSRGDHGPALGRVGVAVSNTRDQARRKLFVRLHRGSLGPVVRSTDRGFSRLLGGYLLVSTFEKHEGRA